MATSITSCAMHEGLMERWREITKQQLLAGDLHA